MEKQVTNEIIYKGRILELHRDEVLLDDNTTSIREVVKHHGGACIALKNKDGKYYMVRQYRYSLGMELLEFCAGKLNENENPKDAIIRETSEELGYTINNLHDLGYIIPTCGYSSEKIYLYYGEEGDYVGTNYDVDERIDKELYTLKEIKEMIKDGRINDAKTIAIVYKMELMGIDE